MIDLLEKLRLVYGKKISREALWLLLALMLTGNGGQAYQLLFGDLVSTTQANTGYAEAFVDGFHAGRNECQ